jgi:hypothetical protein
MDHKEYENIVQKIKKIENGFPIQTLKYKGINFWPLIKANFNFNLIAQITPNFNNLSVKKNFKQKVGDVIFSFKQWQKSKDHLNRIKKDIVGLNNKKIIFISFSSYRNQYIDNKFYNTLSDSFAFNIKDKSELSIIEFSSHNINNKPSFEKIIEGEYFSVKAKTSQNKHLFLKKIKSLFSKKTFDYGDFPYNEFCNYMELHHKDVGFSITDFIYVADYILHLKKVLVDIIKHHTIQYIILPCYYNHESFAATLAGRELGICCIEIQHGIYNKAMYDFKEMKYDLLPHFFFSWDKEQANCINKWNSTYHYHQALPYGIGSVCFWQKNKAFFNNKYLENSINTIQSNANLIHVLYTVSDYYEEKLIDIIKSKKNIFWHIRKHPRTNFNEISFFSQLQNSNCSNYDFENASGAPLYPLLSAMDYHVTSWSSVVCEAILFNVPSILINKDGAFYYEEEYRQHPLIHVAIEKEQIIKLIKDKKNKQEIKEYSMEPFEYFIAKKRVN